MSVLFLCFILLLFSFRSQYRCPRRGGTWQRYPLEKQMEYNSLLLHLEGKKTKHELLVEQLSSMSTEELAALLAQSK